MSLKTFFQILLLIIILIILGLTYSKYFISNKYNDKKLLQSEISKTYNSSYINNNITREKKNEISNSIQNNDVNKNKVNSSNKDIKDDASRNLIKEIEYTTTDKDGNTYNINAVSGKTDKKNKSIFNLNSVNGKISNDQEIDIFIKSDFANYNSSNQNSNFFQNVVVKYGETIITCNNLNINIENNIAKAYENVVVTKPNSTMKAEMITLDLVTKDINISSNINGIDIKTE